MSIITASPSVTPETYARERSAMAKTARLALINRILARAHDETESWRDDSLGVALAYLALAIADGATDSFVDWSDDAWSPSDAVALDLFRSWFPEDDKVWFFILV